MSTLGGESLKCASRERKHEAQVQLRGETLPSGGGAATVRDFSRVTELHLHHLIQVLFHYPISCVSSVTHSLISVSSPGRQKKEGPKKKCEGGASEGVGDSQLPVIKPGINKGWHMQSCSISVRLTTCPRNKVTERWHPNELLMILNGTCTFFSSSPSEPPHYFGIV